MQRPHRQLPRRTVGSSGRTASEDGSIGEEIEAGGFIRIGWSVRPFVRGVVVSRCAD